MDLIKVLLTVRFGRPLTPPWPWEMMDRRRVSFAPRRTREPMLARLQSQAVVAPARRRDEARANSSDRAPRPPTTADDPHTGARADRVRGADVDHPEACGGSQDDGALQAPVRC